VESVQVIEDANWIPTMKHMLPITLALSLMPQGVYAGDREIRTVSGGVLC
jgi:hypothetical protein